VAKKLIGPIRTNADYRTALAEIERYFEKEPKGGTREANRFDQLATALEDYESKKWPIGRPRG
jgi:HTH-type transcriptional regulator / antitoxin HigA